MSTTLEVSSAPCISQEVADILLDELDVAMADLQNLHQNGGYVKVGEAFDILLDFRQVIGHMSKGNAESGVIN